MFIIKSFTKAGIRNDQDGIVGSLAVIDAEN